MNNLESNNWISSHPAASSHLKPRVHAGKGSTNYFSGGMDGVKQESSFYENHFLSLPGIPFWKRVLDLSCVLLTALFWLPLMLLISLIIKIVSPGPSLFRQERIGYLGNRFTCFKFRTMRPNSDTGLHQGHLNHLMGTNTPMKKLDASGDPRLIRCGLLLRTLGIDELPQLFNVLRGEMSLVGPRPCLRYEFENYTPRHRQRLEAVPGLTGLWQVSGKNRTTFEEMIDLDIYYAHHKSLFLDLKIIFKTIPAIISQSKDLSQDVKPALQKRPIVQQ
jgi:lipopolysaccharide/colanic/teichoic acid biosynthesis glycosyltransferase